MNWNYEDLGRYFQVKLENGKIYRIDKVWVQNSMKGLDLTEFDTIKMWLEDEGVFENEEQIALDKKAKENKSTKILQAKSTENKPKTPRERVKKENPTKEAIISYLSKCLQNVDININISDVNIENVGKIITFKVENEEFKLDLTQKRKKKAENV